MNNDKGRVNRTLNRIVFHGKFGLAELRKATAAIHQLRNGKFEDISFDFSACTSAFPSSMSMLCALALKLRSEGLSSTVTPPLAPKAAALFRKTNWLHLLDPDHFPPANEIKDSQIINVPARQFQTDKEQQNSVTMMLNCLLNTRTDLARRDLAAIEWCLGEVTGNVLTHSMSPVGGITQLNRYYQNFEGIEIVVADPGVSIPYTLRSAHKHIGSDKEALSEAIKEGVTSNTTDGMGNGLFGTYQLAHQTHKGYLNISSGYAQLRLDEKGMTLTDEAVPIPGTLVVAAIGVSEPGAIHQALRFTRGVHEPIDFLEMLHEDDNSNIVNVDMSEIESLYSRRSARTLRTRIENHLEMLPDHRIAIHFVGIEVISSSFADECFGKLAERIKMKKMTERLVFEDTNKTIQRIINHAISQRMSLPQPQSTLTPTGLFGP